MGVEYSSEASATFMRMVRAIEGKLGYLHVRQSATCKIGRTLWRFKPECRGIQNCQVARKQKTRPWKRSETVTPGSPAPHTAKPHVHVAAVMSHKITGYDSIHMHLP